LIGKDTPERIIPTPWLIIIQTMDDNFSYGQRGEGLESTIWKHSSGGGSGCGAFVICSSTIDACR
jgi:hypothetical protein